MAAGKPYTPAVDGYFVPTARFIELNEAVDFEIMHLEKSQPK